MIGFVRRNLDPVDRLGEVLFGLIMALGFTAAVRLGHEEADSRALFVGILGCNVAWGIVDGVMYVLAALFERGRIARIAQQVRGASTDEDARAAVAKDVDERLPPGTTEEERRRLHQWLVDVARRTDPQPVRLRADDLLGGLAVAVAILLATFPMLVPFLLVRDPQLAVRLSHGIGLLLLFATGATWGRATGAGPWRIGIGVTVVGAAMASVTVALGG